MIVGSKYSVKFAGSYGYVSETKHIPVCNLWVTFSVGNGGLNL